MSVNEVCKYSIRRIFRHIRSWQSEGSGGIFSLKPNGIFSSVDFEPGRTGRYCDVSEYRIDFDVSI